jgi:hypothetical protein
MRWPISNNVRQNFIKYQHYFVLLPIATTVQLFEYGLKLRDPQSCKCGLLGDVASAHPHPHCCITAPPLKSAIMYLKVHSLTTNTPPFLM